MKTNILISERSFTWLRVLQFALALALGLLIPSAGLPQPITGPLVNALLFLSLQNWGLAPAILVGLVTPLSALTHGVLPLPLMAMIPFIAMGNMVLVAVYDALRNRNRWLALGTAAVAKTALLSLAVTWLVTRPLNVTLASGTLALRLPASMVSMMQWPQLATALAGGLLAWGLTFGPAKLSAWRAARRPRQDD